MPFEGYSKEALDFLARLPTREPAWFKAHKKEYTHLVVDPTKAFVTALGDELRRTRPNIIAEPKTNGSIGPINNDLRFNPDKSPYKDHLLLRFWEGTPKKTAPNLYVRIAPDNVGFATGIVPADLGAWREMLDGDAGAELADAIARIQRTKNVDVVGAALKRVPAPYPADHPRADLLRHKMLQVRWPEDVPTEIHGPTFVGWCVDRLEACLPIHRVLVASHL